MSWVTARRAFARNGENDRPRGDCPQLWSAPRQRSGTFPRWRSSRTVGATAANPERPMPEPYRAVSFAQRSEDLHDQRDSATVAAAVRPGFLQTDLGLSILTRCLPGRRCRASAPNDPTGTREELDATDAGGAPSRAPVD